MVAAAVLVGLLASRVAAAIARDLRRGVFRRVVSFSASETDKVFHRIPHHPHHQRCTADPDDLR